MIPRRPGSTSLKMPGGGECTVLAPTRKFKYRGCCRAAACPDWHWDGAALSEHPEVWRAQGAELVRRVMCDQAAKHRKTRRREEGKAKHRKAHGKFGRENK